MSQGGMAGFAWPGPSPGTAPTASASSVLNSSSATPTVTSTASDGGAIFSSDVPASVTITSTALDAGTFYSSHVPVSTLTASDGGAFFSSEVSTLATVSAVLTSAALDPGVFYSSSVPTLASTASDGGAFFSSSVSTSISGSNTGTHCFYSTLPTAVSIAAGFAFDRGIPSEMSDLTAPAKDMPTGSSSTFTKRDAPGFSAHPAPIVGVVIIVLGILFSFVRIFNDCARARSESADLEKGKYPYFQEMTRGRRRYCDGSPPATRPDDIPILEGYGMDPVDLARAQNWQEGLSEKGAYATQGSASRSVGADNFQSTSTSGGSSGSAYDPPQFPSFMPTRKLVPEPRPVTQLPVLTHDSRRAVDTPVFPPGADKVQNDRNCTRDYRDVSPTEPSIMPHAPSGWL